MIINPAPIFQSSGFWGDLGNILVMAPVWRPEEPKEVPAYEVIRTRMLNGSHVGRQFLILPVNKKPEEWEPEGRFRSISHRERDVSMVWYDETLNGVMWFDSDPEVVVWYEG